MRERLKGLAKVKKRLASGKTVIYCYAWRGGPLLKDKAGNPLQPGDPLLMRAFVEATKDRFVDPTENLNKLITEYKSSTEFSKLSLKSQKEYNRYLDKIRDKFGLMSLVAIQDKRSRGKFKEWRDGMSDKPRTADFAWMVLARVLSVAKDRGRIAINQAERGGRIYSADRTENIWTEDHLDALFAVASEEIKAAVIMALWTGQRKGDLLRAPWSDYDGHHIKVKQGKTGARVKIPASAELRELLDNMPRISPVILTNKRDKTPWTSDGFNSSWSKAKVKAGITDLTFHDLRGTAVTRLALADCSVAQIASITGHSLKDVEGILDAHYLGGKTALADEAIKKLEKFRLKPPEKEKPA